MIERIMEIMRNKGFNSSRFAEEIGIQRAAMSHILNGRNNVSLDVCKKILEKFPEISADWLLFGKGEMISGNQCRLAPIRERRNDACGCGYESGCIFRPSASHLGERTTPGRAVGYAEGYGFRSSSHSRKNNFPDGERTVARRKQAKENRQNHYILFRPHV